MFKEIIPAHSQNHNKLLNTLCGQNVEPLIEVGGTYSCHWA
jgi:hypothetical protein